MYPIFLFAHNWLRWVVLFAGVVIVVLAWLGWLGKRSWSKRERIWGMIFNVAIDLQLVVGAFLYFISPLTTSAFANFAAAMQNAAQRFFVVEHGFAMLIAVVFAHLGSVLSRKATDDQGKFRRSVIWYTLALILILAMIPWDRPLLRGL
ncbi:MAG: hypothetical protein RML93_07300 [Anaerolineales bacterium]|nr:hypothetical protein [Anaerolineales bacterium]MCS7248733.1 hypothetical protein [Anaerolineales bacterium]MDW8162546.1 hypothetical protein [Anaerolineales bacterium]MDW8447079.1 hypothetical protein [Anaerolineales bacterium]